MKEQQEITGKEWKQSLLYIGALVVVITISAFTLLPDHWLEWTVLVVACVVIIIIIAIRQERGAQFECPKCGHEFEISAFKSALAPHGVVKKDGKWYEWKHLECPMCHEKMKMTPTKKEK